MDTSNTQSVPEAEPIDYLAEAKLKLSMFALTLSQAYAIIDIAESLREITVELKHIAARPIYVVPSSGRAQ